MISRHPVILDCDPGIDDAVAILLALASPEEIDLEAITTTAGNVGLERTTLNALGLVALAGREVPVHAGSPKALMGPMRDAADIHGEDGLRGVILPPHSRRPHSVQAVDLIRARLRTAAPRSVTLCMVAPLTNLALALATEPAVVAGIAEIVVMGGAMGLGNVTPAAEFNIWADPEAAAIVLASGAPITILPLDLTHQALATAEHAAALRALGRPAARAVAGIIEAFPPVPRFGGRGIPMHDVCAVARLIAPDLMQGRQVHVEIDCTSGPSRGKTTVDWWDKLKRAPNATVLDRIDAGGFFALMHERLARL